MHPSQNRSSVGPRWLPAVLAAVAAIAVFGLVSSLWARAYPLDSDRVADAAAVALADPAVVDALASAVTDQAVDLVLSVADPLDMLPGPLQGLGAAGEQLIRSFLTEQVARVVATDTVQDALVGAVRSVHAQTVELIQDGQTESGVFVLDDGVVRLDVTAALAASLDELVERDLAPGSLSDLQKSLRGGVDDLSTWLLDNTGIDVGDDVGTVAIYDSGAVDEGGLALRSARWMTSRTILGPLGWTVVLAAAAVGAIALSGNRRRTVMQFGIALIVVAVVSTAYWTRVRADILELIADPRVSEATGTLIDQLTRPLAVATITMLLVGALVAGLARWLPTDSGNENRPAP